MHVDIMKKSLFLMLFNGKIAVAIANSDRDMKFL